MVFVIVLHNHYFPFINNKEYFKRLPMKNKSKALLIIYLLFTTLSFAQTKDSLTVAAIIKEANENSQLEMLATELMDGIGPRLLGTPKMQQAHNWAVSKYNTWGIAARNEKWGEWRG